MEVFEDDDPFEWSIDQVINYLCHSSAPWARPSLPRPDPKTLEATLRENDVTGEVLLTEVDKATLAQDLGLRSLGQRSTIFRAVQYLQQRSRRYAEHIQPFRVGNPHLTATTPQNALGFVLPLESPSVPLNFPSPVHTPSAIPKTSTHGNANARVRERNDTSEEQREFEVILPTGSSSSKVRPNEHYIIDSSGSKRRKLSLSKPTTSGPGARQEKPGFKQPCQYIGPKKVTLSDVFYNDMEDSDDESFVLEGAKCPIGQKRFVNKRVQHYFLEEPRAVETKDGNDAVARFPYSAKIIPKGEPQYFTLFSQNEGAVKVTKEDIIAWPQLNQGRDELDYLLAKYPASEDQGLPLYGESDSENGYDSETWREIELEKKEIDASKKEMKKLSIAEIDSIIDGCIDSFSQKWHNHKLPIQQTKAQQLWLSSRQRNSKHSDVKSAGKAIAHLESRLKSLRKAIKDTPWSKAHDVQQQCHSMEETVFNREVEKWKISILELDSCPPKPPPFSPKTGKLPKPCIPEDEEWLSSEWEDETVDNINDFIVSVDDIATQISGKVSETEDDIISPKTFRKRRQKIPSLPESKILHQRSPEPNRLTTLTSPAQLRQMQQQRPTSPIEVVDLTKSSDEASEPNFEVHTPPLNPVNPVNDINTKLSPSPRSQLLSEFTRIGKKKENTSSLRLPASPDIEEIAETDWSVVEKRHDRGLLLRKLVWAIPLEEHRELYELIRSTNFGRARKCFQRVLRGILSKQHPLQTSQKHALYLRAAVLYVAWHECKMVLAMRGIPKTCIGNTLNDQTSFGVFHPLLCEALKTLLDKKDEVTKESPGQPPPISSTKEVGSERLTSSKLSADEQSGNSDFEEHSPTSEPEEHHTPHKRRKRAVKESQEAMDTQRNAQRRVELQEQQRKRLARKLQGTGISNSDPERQAVSFDDPVIYLHSHIGARVKPHQLSGIQFMWRELIKDEKHQGCLLAHTMGLGKTMQVISLLITIANAAASDDPKVRIQVPESLRLSRTLVLCPSSLIENWWDELLMWTPGDDPKTSRNLGPFRKILPTLQLEERLDGITAWYKEGGILLMSYDIFRALILNKARKNRPPVLDDHAHGRVRKHLLEGPRIIVADEAHKLKNRKAGVAEACGTFVSKSRIALTGSPLANNLREYYAMIDWIAPGYLGEFVQFKAKYIEPIEEGLYADSSQWERRNSLKKLQVLKKDIDPKLNRADISVLKGSLPPKVEFVITVPLTTFQEQAYNAYIDSLASDKEAMGNPRLWDWLSILSLLCNHPACFMEKLRDRSKGVQNSASNWASIDSDCEMPGDAPISQVHSPEMLTSLEKVFATDLDLQSLELSYRAQIADKIIELSIAVGDKVLLFSHSIPTLNYLEHVLRQAGRTYSRLDGKTPIATRQISTKNFNSGSYTQVYLISTRAGGLGLNIPGANRVIIFDFQFNPTWEEQAVGRAYRLGQRKPVFVYRFLAGGTFEDIMHNKAVFKTQLSYRVVDKMNPVRWASKFSKDYLFKPKVVQQRDLTEFKGKDPSVLDLILYETTNIRKIALTETFQREDSDKLTPEEEKAVQEELDDERLKRNDPAAWARKNRERELRESSARSVAYHHPSPQPPMGAFPYSLHHLANGLASFAPTSMPPAVPSTNSVTGPPALSPDTSLFNCLNGSNSTNNTRLFTSWRPSANENMSSVPPSPFGTITNNPRLLSGQTAPHHHLENSNQPLERTNNGIRSPAVRQGLDYRTDSTSTHGEDRTSYAKTGTSGCRQQ
ncbi:hypothetical protein PABG_06730 [Paracoccidioides brasiliensis Pb03]|nr:hypothetical protein PABG_06730 [Paracoccidioides brasiliensis Pb03]